MALTFRNLLPIFLLAAMVFLCSYLSLLHVSDPRLLLHPFAGLSLSSPAELSFPAFLLSLVAGGLIAWALIQGFTRLLPPRWQTIALVTMLALCGLTVLEIVFSVRMGMGFLFGYII